MELHFDCLNNNDNQNNCVNDNIITGIHIDGVAMVKSDKKLSDFFKR